MRKLMQHLNQKQALEMRQGPVSKNARKARTRTLIQLGGLIEKAGLLNLLDLETGQDLQKDDDTVNAAATLMGSLLFLKEFFYGEEAKTHQLLWRLRGKEALRDPRQLQPSPVTEEAEAA
jgi:hypothetical protein